MACYIVCCALKAPERDYADLVEAMERVGSATWPCFESTWLVNAQKTAAQIRDELKPYLDGNDQILVIEVGTAAAWRGISATVGLKAVLAG